MLPVSAPVSSSFRSDQCQASQHPGGVLEVLGGEKGHDFLLTEYSHSFHCTAMRMSTFMEHNKAEFHVGCQMRQASCILPAQFWQASPERMGVKRKRKVEAPAGEAGPSSVEGEGSDVVLNRQLEDEILRILRSRKPGSTC